MIETVTVNFGLFIISYFAFNSMFFLVFGFLLYYDVKNDNESHLKYIFLEEFEESLIDRIYNKFIWILLFPIMFPVYTFDLIREKYDWMCEDERQ